MSRRIAAICNLATPILRATADVNNVSYQTFTTLGVIDRNTPKKGGLPAVTHVLTMGASPHVLYLITIMNIYLLVALDVFFEHSQPATGTV